jgi:hypothetical protein
MSLIDKGLVREIRAKADAPIWHEHEDGRLPLKITRAGREAIGADEEDAQDASTSASPEPAKSRKSGWKALRPRRRRLLRRKREPAKRRLRMRI